MKKKTSKIIFTVLGIFLCFVLSIFAVGALCVISIPAIWTDDRSCLSDNPQVQLLKSYVSEQTLESMNPDFYTYFGFRDWWRAPLVYPYSIHVIDGLESGYLVDESAITDYETASLQNGVDLFSGIQRFTFDKNYLLVDRGSDFILFKFQTGESQPFETEQDLITEAQNLQFEGNFEFITLKDYNALFLCGE
jgi:hypothetical protein